jgi:UDP-N-acetylglucosamine transferase subunit ALG13
MFWNQLLSLVNKAWISKDASDSLSVFKTEAYFICCTFLSNFLQHVSLPENFIVAIIPILEAVNNLLSKTKPFTTIGDSNKKDFQEIFNSLKKLSNQAYISLLHAHLHLCTQLDNWMNPCDSQKPTNFSSTFLQPSITSDSYRETLIESTQKHMKIVTNYLKAASQKKNLPDILLETSIGEILLKSCHLLLELCIAYPIRYYKDRTTSVKVIKVLRILFLFNSKIKKKKFIQYQHFCSLLPLCCALMEQFQKTSCSVSVFVKLFKKITHKIFKYFIIDATNFFYAKHENIFDFSIQFLPMFFQKMDTLIYNFILDLPLMYQYIVLCGLKKIAEKKLIKAMRLLTHNFKKQSTFQIEKFLILLKVFSCFFNRYPGIFFIKSRNASAIMKFLKKLCHAIPSLNVVCLDRNYHQLNNEMKKNMYMIHLVDSLINFVIYQSGSSFCLKPSCLKYVLIVCSSLQSCIKQMANQIIEHYHMPTIIQLLQLNSKLLHFFIHHLYQCDMGKHKKRMMRCIEGINILCFPILNLQLTDSLTSASNSLFENHLQLCITFPCNNFVSCFNFLQTLPAFYFVRKTLIAFPHLQIQACTLNASFIENVYSFLSPLTINEDISFIEQLTYLTSSYFLSILIILCQSKKHFKT